MNSFHKILQENIKMIKKNGLYKHENVITSPQESVIKVQNKNEVLNFCSNNYLGLSNHPSLINAAIKGIQKFGYGLSSVRFICGTQNIHKKLEKQISKFLFKEDTILYTSCFDANGGLFETLLSEKDAIISDELNHASIIDGIRLCKAARFRYSNSNIDELEKILKKTQNYGVRLITTDGVFSMDGFIAKLDKICILAKEYNALVHIDDSHATGFVGNNGRGSGEYHNVLDKIDIITSTFGKALGGASGGFTSARKEIITTLRQKSRPYLFSNSLSPGVVCASIKAIDMISTSSDLIQQLNNNTTYFRTKIKNLGFKIQPGNHPIVPIMIYNAHQAKNFASEMLSKGIYVISFSYPVVPIKQARIRVQISAAHTKEQIDKSLEIFQYAGKKLGII